VSFWKIHFLNPPEVRGQVVRVLIYGEYKDEAKVSKSPISVNRKIEESNSEGEFHPQDRVARAECPPPDQRQLALILR
jgi:hypothetical protein